MKFKKVLAVFYCCVCPYVFANDQVDEEYRPTFHFTPKQQWMNDPNGMVYLNGEYHLFFQYNPYGNIWGPMHWGHAITKDLVHWEELPIALFPDNNGAIYSGSAVYDKNNTSGFGSSDHAPLVAIFTYHDLLKEMQGRSDFQNQGLAYSLDSGRSWQKYAANPVLKSINSKDFRDPKVMWHEASKKWVMSLAVKNKISFYSSKDLKVWTHESDFGESLGVHTGVWECPDLFEINVQGGNAKKYVLLVSLNPGGINGGSATQYFVGDFDGSKFTLDKKFSRQLVKKVINKESPSEWVDYGADNYAGVTWSNLPSSDNRIISLGWMNNWDYGNKIPIEKWRGATTLPRELTLAEKDGKFILKSFPVKELNGMVKSSAAIQKQVIKGKVELFNKEFKTFAQHIHLQIDPKRSKKISFDIGSDTEKSTLVFDLSSNQITFDRASSGKKDFSEAFTRLQHAPFVSTEKSITLDFYVDKASIEIFVNAGELAITNQVFPTKAFNSFKVSTESEIDLIGGNYDFF
jgi:fructan beta-fructosidase